MIGISRLAVALAASAFLSAPAAAQRQDTLRLALPDAVNRALQSSDEVRVSLQQVDLADAQVTAARAAGLPQLRLNTNYSHAFQNARAQAVGQVFNQTDTYNANLNFSQALFQGGRIFAATRAATDVRAATRFDAEEVRARVAVDVQRAYLQALYAARLVDLQSRNLALASDRLAQVEQLERAGRAARYDVLRARVERANIEPLVIQARNDREIAELELKRLLNVPLEQPLALSTVIDAAALDAILAAIPDTAVDADRRSVRAAELSASARREGIRVARADFLPTVNLTFQNGYQAFPPPGFGFPDRLGSAAAQFCDDGGASGRVCQNGGWFADRSLGIQLSVPVFDGLRARGNLGVARAQSRLADLELQQERERVAVEVARARAELSRARAAYAARQQTAAEAAEAFELAQLRFSRGLSTQLEVSDAQLAMLTAQSGEARATFDVYLAASEFARAVGRPLLTPPTSSTR